MARPLTEFDRWTFNEGTHIRLFEVMGSHLDRDGAYFRVWAPSATAVAVVGDFNGWDDRKSPMQPDPSGIWEIHIPGVRKGNHYKYSVRTPSGEVLLKQDPYAFMHETAPRTASVVWNLDYEWNDRDYMASRAGKNDLDAPISIYEVHFGSWRHDQEVSYRTIAPRLADYAAECGFTHVELLPVMEHPFYGSWGYQVTGYFAPTSRYGSAQDLMYLVDVLHQRGIGVIFDWVPSHFPSDLHALARFDGTHLYEHADPRLGLHPDWNSLIFNYDRHEVRSFLTSSAMFWLERFHADGLRVDAVASMLYRDYSRREGEWIPNEHGGRENVGAIEFLRHLNTHVYKEHPDVQVYAEESTAWPMVSRPVDAGGLGFGLKWDMGWMHDTLRYLSRDPIYRSHHHNELTFRSIYASTENYVLPLSHDEVVHGKGSLLGKQHGDDWQKFAGLRLLYGYQHALPGKKLLFMGGEFAQRYEWNHNLALDWAALDAAPHQGVRNWVRDLNQLYRCEPALHELDCDPAGFRWVEADDRQLSVLAFLRLDRAGRPLLVVVNFTPVPRDEYRIGVPVRRGWSEVLNSDAENYGGSGVGNLGRVIADYVPWHGYEQSIGLSLPPLGILFLRPET